MACGRAVRIGSDWTRTLRSSFCCYCHVKTPRFKEGPSRALARGCLDQGALHPSSLPLACLSPASLSLPMLSVVVTRIMQGLRGVVADLLLRQPSWGNNNKRRSPKEMCFIPVEWKYFVWSAPLHLAGRQCFPADLSSRTLLEREVLDLDFPLQPPISGVTRVETDHPDTESHPIPNHNFTNNESRDFCIPIA